MIPYGTLIVFVTPQEKRYVKKLRQNEDWQSHNGTLKAETVHLATAGEYVQTSTGVPILLQEATLPDILMGLKRQTQIIFPKDIAYICMRLGVGPGKIIGEAGCGSGSLTLALSWYCGMNGKIISQDSREEFIQLTRRNLDWANMGQNVTLLHQDAQNGLAVEHADSIFIDMREPWLILEEIEKAIKPGGNVGFLLPTINQIARLLVELEKMEFGSIDICELLLRQWKPVPDRIRPRDRMNAHTGFLLFCRQQTRIHDFSLNSRLGTRERKEKAAWETRNITAEKINDRIDEE